MGTDGWFLVPDQRPATARRYDVLYRLGQPLVQPSPDSIEIGMNGQMVIRGGDDPLP